MTRKSKREIERALEALAEDDDPGEFSDARESVTAEFVTYESDREPWSGVDIPDGWTVSATSLSGGAEVLTLERDGERGEGR
ncbi:hypothetical protein HWV07_04350 [Natronomonas salina]|uniref:hypothetical protein n=1 Tax=Natronomonas salina TaxID=1710540 RepID=UPI0015B6DADA|nr:hypothetical protein [Natronomonas salina]QLD88305.1 hypothetical protein HWV07_04350 [Natronomonas salina]